MKTKKCFIFSEDSFLIEEDNSIPNLDKIKELGFNVEDTFDLGEYKGDEYVLVSCESFDESLPLKKTTLRDFSRISKEDDFLNAGKAFLFSEYHRLNKHCGVCGGKMSYQPFYHDTVLKCESCGNITWPRVSNAIIVAVTNGDKLLLAHNKNFAENKYSILAGFVDYGETLEATVEREIMEEVGLKIKNIKYFGSQPWPFPNSYMIGFTAEYDSGEIKVDDVEIEKAGWFTKEEVKEIYTPSISISTKLIEWFLNK